MKFNQTSILFYANRSLRVNNFDLLRFLFAVTIFLVHTYSLSKNNELAWFKRILSTEIAVESFFGLGVAGGLVFFTAYVFWHFIEKPFLKKSSHYVEVNRG